jgi:hypothetical protein
MNTYLAKFEDFLRNIEETAKKTVDSHHKRILENYLKHLALEFSGDWAAAMDPGMMVEEPRYLVKLGSPETIPFEGKSGVTEFYTSMFANNVMLQDDRLSVGDWGVASFCTVVQFLPGSVMTQMGMAVDDLDGLYIVETPISMAWPFDADARVAGEEVYALDDAVITKAAPDQVVTMDQRAEIARTFLKG